MKIWLKKSPDGAPFGVLARADTNYLSPGLTGTNHAQIQAGTVTINGTATINIANCPFATNSYPLFTGYSSGNLALGVAGHRQQFPRRM